MNCKWGTWQLKDCSTSCGEGRQVKFRKVATHASGGGKACEGESSRSQSCNYGTCPGILILCDDQYIYGLICLCT